jgi:hypothetical protein
MILQTKLINHFFVLVHQLILIGSFIAILVYYNFHIVFIIPCLVYFVLNNIPAMYLHYEYWKVNNEETYEITNNEIIRRKGGVEERFYFKEIEKIIVYKSASADKGGIYLSSMEAYYYVRIAHRSGEEMIMTCLLSPHVDKTVKRYRGVPFERKKWLFCSIKRK